MTKLINSICLSLTLFLCFITVVMAQNNKTNSAQQNKSLVSNSGELSVNQQIALSLLDSLYQQSKTVESEPFKIRTQAQIADTLWQYDESRARRMFRQAFDAIDLIKTFPKSIPQPPGSKPDVEHLKEGMRFEIVQIVSRRDAKFAETLMKAVKNAESENASNNADEAASMRELQLAAALAKTNPEKAAQIVRNRLRSGFDANLVSLILVIKQQNEALSNQLFTDFIAEASKEPPSIMKLASLAMYLTPNEEEAFLGQDKPISATVIRQYLNFAYSELQQWINAQRQSAADEQIDRQTAARDFVILKQIIMPLFEKNSPSQSSSLRLQLASLFERQSVGRSGSSSGENRDEVQELIDKADATVGTKQRDSLYIKAAMLAKRKGNVDKALSIAEKVTNEDDRIGATSVIAYQAGFDALKQGNTDEALTFARKILFTPQKTYLYDKIAQKLLQKKDRSRALEILDELKTWLSKTDNSGYKAEGLLFIATTIAVDDPTQGFESMRLAVDVINKTDFSLKNNSQSEAAIKTIPKTLESLDLKPIFSILARADFNQALSLAQSFTKKEAAVTAQLAVCQEELRVDSAIPTKNRNKKSPSK